MAPANTVLVTGGGGMVGRHVRAHPAADGWTVLAPTSAELDLTDNAAVTAYFAEHRPGLVVHAAGRVGGIQANMAHPVAFLEQNMAMGRNVIMAAFNAGVPHVLNLASTCMYPRAAPNPLTEDMILTGELEPTNEGYALAKIMSTRLCEYICRERPDFAYKTLIPTNLYGPFDTFDPQKSHLIPSIIHKIHRAIADDVGEVVIWGDGTARREFMYAGDLADAVWAAVADIESIPGVMNIGLGYDFSVNDYYAVVADVLGWSGRFVHDLSKPTGMKQKLSSVSRQTEWGWRPATSLQAGLAKTYAFYRESIST